MLGNELCWRLGMMPERVRLQAGGEGSGVVTTAACGECCVTTRWLGFYRVWQGSGEVFDAVDLFLPDVQFNTQVRRCALGSSQLCLVPGWCRPLSSLTFRSHLASSSRYDYPESTCTAHAQAAYIRVPHSARGVLAAQGLPFRDGLHAASHALVNVMPLFLLCSSQDLGTECDNPYDTRFRPERLLVFDKHPGGIGLAKQARVSSCRSFLLAWAVLLGLILAWWPFQDQWQVVSGNF